MLRRAPKKHKPHLPCHWQWAKLTRSWIKLKLSASPRQMPHRNSTDNIREARSKSGSESSSQKSYTPDANHASDYVFQRKFILQPALREFPSHTVRVSGHRFPAFAATQQDVAGASHTNVRACCRAESRTRAPCRLAIVPAATASELPAALHRFPGCLQSRGPSFLFVVPEIPFQQPSIRSQEDTHRMRRNSP